MRCSLVSAELMPRHLLDFVGLNLTTAALLVAAGRGSRAVTGAAAPKQYVPLAGVALLTHTLRRFVNSSEIDGVHVVIHRSDEALFAEAVAEFGPHAPTYSFGGETRQDSVRLGLEGLSERSPSVTSVLIHDAARPFVDRATIKRVVTALETHVGAIAAEPVSDTLKTADNDGQILGTVPRDGLWRAQTPQGFRFAQILRAHRDAIAAGHSDFTDDAALAEWAGLPVYLVPGSSRNVKVTTPEDLVMAELNFRIERQDLEPRVGTGFDVHKFSEGDHVWLCGVRIAHDAGLLGHSDADAPLHALTDALLGAIGDGDIGQHFPPSDPQWKGASSDIFLKDAVRRVQARGGRIVNVDMTIMCEAPKIGPHHDAMKQRLADLLKIDGTRVGLKATTTETLGFTGRREGLAALASVSVLIPAPETSDVR